MMLIYWEETKHTFCGVNERGALWVASNEINLVVNAEGKVGNIQNTDVGKQVF
jgi:hypothetical protein